MHECLLFAAVPAAQHDHVLRVLAGISAMQPLAIRNCHIVFKPTRTASSLASIPNRAPGNTAKPGAINPFAANTGQTSNDLFYLQLVGDFTRSQSSKDRERERERERENVNASANANEMDLDTTSDESHDPSTVTTGEEELWSSHSWALNFAAVPDVPGKRPATSRLVSSVPLTHDNQRLFLQGLGYEYVTSYLVAGYRLTHGHLDVSLCRTYPLDQTTTAAAREMPVASMLALRMGAGEKRKDGASGTEDDVLVGLHDVKPLDPSGGYLLQVSVKVSDGSKPELMNTAFAELTAFRDTLRGVVRLQPGERMALDTRVRAGGGVAQTGQGRGTTAAR